MKTPDRGRRSRALRPSMEALETLSLLSVSAPTFPSAAAPVRSPLVKHLQDDKGHGVALAPMLRERLQANREAALARWLVNHPGHTGGRGSTHAGFAHLRPSQRPAFKRAVADAFRGRNDDSGSTLTTNAKATAGSVTVKGRGYELITLGNTANVDVLTSPGEVLMGGGTDVAQAFQWMGIKSFGGDFLVIRASGTDAYDPYINGLGTFDSVSTLIMTKREAAFDPFVLQQIANADALFIAGGDQADYETLWKGTPLAAELDRLAARAPIGGTSAGLAVLGETDFAALNGTITSDQALADPYGRRVSLTSDFLTLPGLDNVITDSHFVTRDRMGRLVTFLARTVADGGNVNGGVPAPMLGIGINEQTALLVEPGGSARVVSNLPLDPTSNVYLVRTPATLASTDFVSPGTPLTFGGVTVYRAHAGDSFDVNDPTTWSGLASYTLTAQDGVLTSSSGNYYA